MTTGPITVIPAPATHLVVISQPPALVTPGTTFGFVVAAEDDFGNIATATPAQIAVAVPSGSGAVLGGTTSVTPAGGEATFSGLDAHRVERWVALTVTSTGLTSVDDQRREVTTPAVLAFATSSVTVNPDGGHGRDSRSSRTGGYDGAISVNVATSNGTAVAGVNYTAVNQVLSFAAGQNSQTVTVPISSTDFVLETVTVNLTLEQPGSQRRRSAASRRPRW